MFSHAESSNNLRYSTALQATSIKTVMHSSETISSLRQKCGTFTKGIKKNCLLHYSIRKFVNEPQRIAHVAYAKRT